MGNDLDILIAAAIALKQGDKQFILSYDVGESGLDWTAEIGNPSKYVRLGESEGEFTSRGWPTPEAAVADLIRIIKKEQS